MKRILGAIVLALVMGAHSSPQTSTKISAPTVRQALAEARSQCPECDVYTAQGETPNSRGEMGPATFILVRDGGDKLRAHRLELADGTVVVIHFPSAVVDVKLQKFAKRLGK